LLLHTAPGLQDAIAKVVANGARNTEGATRKSISYAKMANSAARPYMFDDEGARRHLLQSTAAYQRSDKMQMAGMAAQVSVQWGGAGGQKITEADTICMCWSAAPTSVAIYVPAVHLLW
jgi:hypothetical protein